MAQPDGDAAGRGLVEVAPGIAVLGVPAGVGGPAVELDEDLLALVGGICVLRAAADPASLLPGRGGQLVGALDVAEVAVLQDRLGPALDVVEHLEDQSAVTEPAAGIDGGAKACGRGRAGAHRVGEDANDLVLGGGQVDGQQGIVLRRQAGWAGRPDLRGESGDPVQPHARRRDDPTRGVDGHVHQRSGSAEEAHGGTRPAGEHRHPLALAGRERSGVVDVDPAMDRAEQPRTDPAAYVVRLGAALDELAVRDDSVLVREVGQEAAQGRVVHAWVLPASGLPSCRSTPWLWTTINAETCIHLVATGLRDDGAMTSRAPVATPLVGVPFWPAAAFVLVWSSGYVAGPAGVEVVSPFWVLVLRFAVAALMLYPLARLTRGALRISREDLVRVAASGLVMNGLLFGTMYAAFELGLQATLGALLHSLSPVLTAVLAGVLLGERLTRLQVVGFVVGVVGVVVVLGPDIDRAGGVAGLLLGVASLACLSLGTLGQRWIGTRTDPIWSATLQCAVCVPPLVVLAVLVEGAPSVTSGVDATVAVLWLAGVNSVLGLLLLGLLVRRGGAGASASVFFLMPPVTAVLAWVLLDERLTGLAVLGLALSTVGVAVATRRRA